ncbi:hypothetical protein AAFF_G00223210 [Aldrovandia affinis]|uniref:Uncharacterized protein n=1 Tax=Aldrovandia affinis TaxID=143900 RepID=A0AAD7RFA3_9TELE|nr:hypothetical protein AAFF_G00223210 [Aldrovandia affinis]
MKRKRRAQNPKIAEAVRRLHNSEGNSRRYEPEQGLSSPRNEADLAVQAEAVKNAARSRQRRKRLLEARQSVLVPDYMDFWRGVTIDLMSDEEDCIQEGSFLTQHQKPQHLLS